MFHKTDKTVTHHCSWPKKTHTPVYIGGDTEMLQTQKNVIKLYMFETDTVLQSHCIIHSVEIYELLLLLQVFQMNKKTTWKGYQQLLRVKINSLCWHAGLHSELTPGYMSHLQQVSKKFSLFSFFAVQQLAGLTWTGYKSAPAFTHKHTFLVFLSTLHICGVCRVWVSQSSTAPSLLSLLPLGAKDGGEMRDWGGKKERVCLSEPVQRGKKWKTWKQ